MRSTHGLEQTTYTNEKPTANTSVVEYTWSLKRPSSTHASSQVPASIFLISIMGYSGLDFSIANSHHFVNCFFTYISLQGDFPEGNMITLSAIMSLENNSLYRKILGFHDWLIDSILGLFNWLAMDILIEYLESSTIHGLAYISTAKVQV